MHMAVFLSLPVTSSTPLYLMEDQWVGSMFVACNPGGPSPGPPCSHDMPSITLCLGSYHAFIHSLPLHVQVDVKPLSRFMCDTALSGGGWLYVSPPGKRTPPFSFLSTLLFEMCFSVSISCCAPFLLLPSMPFSFLCIKRFTFWHFHDSCIHVNQWSMD